MAYVNVAEWSPEHVADWLRGLDDEVQPYTQFFVNNSVNGCHLLTLCRDDLANLNISKIGHQESVLEAVDLLKQLHYNLTSETLQSLALKLGCKAQSLFNHLKHMCKGNDEGGKKERVSTETLSAVSDILNLVKSLISWLDRYPFLGQEKYVNVRKAVLKLSVELASTAQRDQFAEMPHKVIKEICSNLSKQSDKIVQEFNDSLIIQPAILEVAKIKRKVDDDVGIHINSSCIGIHVIESIKFQSPAYRCGKVEDGDEIVQVNYQTVVGWQVRNIICAMKEHPSEVHLTLKKRPRHPNVLGQVITLWPYRIPSKKTALRKLYKWNKVKTTGNINDMCPKSPDPRGDINSVPDNFSIPVNDKERQIFFGRSRSRIRRRATVTGISPTALQPLINLDDFIGSNSKKKQSVGRAVSYDPGKVGNVEDSVFKDDAQDADFVPKTSDSAKSENTGKGDKEATNQKSQFLKPPTEKYLGSCLKRQQPVQEISPQSEVSDIKLMVDFAKADTEMKLTSTSSSESPLKSPCILSTKKESSAGSDGPKLKFDWLQKQKAKLEGMANGNPSLHQKPRSGSTVSCPGSESTQPNARINGNNTTSFTLRESRPSLSEIRALKRAADSKAPNERVESYPRKNVPSLPRQNVLHKRNMQQSQLGCSGIKYGNAKENELNYRLNGVSVASGKKTSLSIPQNCTKPEFMKYSVIPQYPYEMHKSKIVSLKHKANSNHLNQPRNRISYVSETLQKGAINVLPTKKNQLLQKPSQTRTSVKNSQNSGKPAHPFSFSPLYGRSRSYNDIAFSSDSSSYNDDDDDDEVYEEIDESRNRFSNKKFHLPNVQTFNREINSSFAAKLAEAYYMLNQGHCFPTPPNGALKKGFDPASSAFIDELAKRMYQALQEDHMKAKTYIPGKNASYVPVHKNGRSKSLSRECTYSKNVPEDEIYGRLSSHVSYDRQSYNQSYVHYLNTNQLVKNNNMVTEKPVDLSPPTYATNKHPIPAFKSATSQEIHNLYTSQAASKSPNGNYSQCNFDKQQDCPSIFLQNENSGKAPIYESLSFFRESQPQYTRFAPSESSVRIGQGNQSIIFCPAERESESVQCNDKIISTPSDGWKYFDKGMFQPIREETSVDDENSGEEYVPSHDLSNDNRCENRIPSQSSNELSLYLCQTAETECCNNKCNGVTISNAEVPSNKHNYKDVPPSITSLMSSMPKPPEEDCCSKTRKCSDAQTETENVPCLDFNGELLKDDVAPLNLGNDDSFCTQNSDVEIPDFTRSSSLSSSASSSTISSTNSCYYYVDTQNPPHKAKVSSVSSEKGNETSLDSLRSPVLPTMGVSMLSKKRPSNSSDSGCNSEPHQHSVEDLPTAAATINCGDDFKSSGIIKDVEHTI